LLFPTATQFNCIVRQHSNEASCGHPFAQFFKTSVFSALLNNLAGLTLNPNYVGICGIMQEELGNNFEPEMEAILKETGKSQEGCLEKLRWFYNIQKNRSKYITLSAFSNTLTAMADIIQTRRCGRAFPNRPIFAVVERNRQTAAHLMLGFSCRSKIRIAAGHNRYARRNKNVCLLLRVHNRQNSQRGTCAAQHKRVSFTVGGVARKNCSRGVSTPAAKSVTWKHVAVEKQKIYGLGQ